MNANLHYLLLSICVFKCYTRPTNRYFFGTLRLPVCKENNLNTNGGIVVYCFLWWIWKYFTDFINKTNYSFLFPCEYYILIMHIILIMRVLECTISLSCIARLPQGQ